MRSSSTAAGCATGATWPVSAPERQGRFRTLLETQTDLDELVGRAELLSLVNTAARVDGELAGRLERIAHLEALLAPAEALFQHILARQGQPVEDVAAAISRHWGPRAPNLDRTAFADLMPEIRAKSNTPIARAIDGCHETLGTGDYAGAIRSLLDWNKAVMETRGGRCVGAARRSTPARCPLSGRRAAAARTGTTFPSCGATATSSTL